MSMEVKVNKDIGEYTESVFFGMSLRQCIFSLLAIGIAVAIYFTLHGVLGNEEISWVCVLGAGPFAVMAFFKFHGLTPEKFVVVWIKSEILIPRYLTFQGENAFWRAVVRLRKKECNTIDYKARIQAAFTAIKKGITVRLQASAIKTKKEIQTDEHKVIEKNAEASFRQI